MATQVNLYQAKTQLSSLVERASKGEEIIIAKAGKPMAVLSPLRSGTARGKRPAQNLPDFWKQCFGHHFPGRRLGGRHSARVFRG